MVISERCRDIAGFFGELALFVVGVENLGFDFCSAFLIDGVSNVDVESWTTTCVFWRTCGIQTLPAFIAIDSTEVVLAVALTAAVHHLTARHGDEGPPGTVDDFYIPNDEGILEGHGAERE